MTERGSDLDVCQCSSCGLIQLNSLPVHYYKEVVRAAAFSPEMRGHRLQQFKRFAEDYNLINKKVFEVGCGKGEYLSVIAEAGMQAHGFEYSAESVLSCLQQGLVAFEDFIEEPIQEIADAPYAAFFMLSFLEHVPDPVRTLRGIANNLEEDGLGLIEVPNFDMIVKNGLFSEFIADHLFYFTEKTFSHVLNTSGFEVIDCRSSWYDYLLTAIVRKRRSINLDYFIDFEKKIGSEIHQFLRRFKRREVAAWGAGHQALAVINLVGIGQNLRYVIDSATFKQGKFTPGSHVPIVEPDRLRIDPVKAIIVMAGSYSDEVSRIIKDKYTSDISIAILRDFGLEVISCPN